MKNDIIEYKKELEKTDKYTTIKVEDGEFLIYGDEFYTIEDLVKKTSDNEELIAISDLEKMLFKIVKELYQNDVLFDEIKVIIEPTFFVNKKDIAKTNNINIKNISKDILLKNIVIIKYQFEVLNDGKRCKFLSQYSSIFNNADSCNYIYEINQTQKDYYVDIEKYYSIVNNNGYELNANNVENLFELLKNKEALFIDIKFEKEFTKELRLK